MNVLRFETCRFVCIALGVVVAITGGDPWPFLAAQLVMTALDPTVPTPRDAPTIKAPYDRAWSEALDRIRARNAAAMRQSGEQHREYYRNAKGTEPDHA